MKLAATPLSACRSPYLLVPPSQSNTATAPRSRHHWCGMRREIEVLAEMGKPLKYRLAISGNGEISVMPHSVLGRGQLRSLTPLCRGVDNYRSSARACCYPFRD